MKISSVFDADQRKQVAAALAELLTKPPEALEVSWLQEMRTRGTPLYGTMAAQPGQIVRFERTGTHPDASFPHAEG